MSNFILDNLPLPQTKTDFQALMGGTDASKYFLAADANTIRQYLSDIRDYSLQRNFFSVKQFGAKGDNVTDDALAIQNAFNALVAAGGGRLHFPYGTYRIASIHGGILDCACGMLFSSPNLFPVQLTGDQATIRYDGDPTRTMWNIGGPSNGAKPWLDPINLVDFTVTGLSFVGTRTGSSDTDIEVTQGNTLLEITYAEQAKVYGCSFKNSLGSGIYFSGLRHSSVLGNSFVNCNGGIQGQDSEGLSISHNSFKCYVKCDDQIAVFANDTPCKDIQIIGNKVNKGFDGWKNNAVVQASGTGTASATVTGTPSAHASVVVKIVAGAANLAAGPTAAVSTDGGQTYGSTTTIPSGGTYALGNGQTLHWVDGTFVTGDLYTIATRRGWARCILISGGVNGVRIADNTLADSGSYDPADLINESMGGVAFETPNTSQVPKNVQIENNEFRNLVYGVFNTAGLIRSLKIHHNHFTGIANAAIESDGTTGLDSNVDVSIVGNTFTDCGNSAATGTYLVKVFFANDLHFFGNKVNNCKANRILQLVNSAQLSDQVNISKNVVVNPTSIAPADGVVFDVQQCRRLTVTHNEVNAKFQYHVLASNRGDHTDISFNLFEEFTGSDFLFAQGVFTGCVGSYRGEGNRARQSGQDWSGRNRFSKSVIGWGSVGAYDGIRLNLMGETAPVSGWLESGYTAPTTGTWSTGDALTNSSPSELGTAGSKYVITGWRCTAGGTPGTWLPMRALTGN